jgi:branched-chain amino acid transport system ATP-binding protein
MLDPDDADAARALATRPRILLLDEIAGGLTDAECHILIETIRSIHARGISIIWIEHVVHALLAVVSRLVVLDFGRIVAQGLPSEVMRSSEVQTIYMGVPA